MKVPPMVEVKSSNLQKVGHNADGLWIRFSGGALYRYPDAPKSAFDAIVQAESPGRAFVAHVRGKYQHRPHDDV